MTFEDLGFSKVDLDREERTGVPEVIFGMGKTSEQVQEIFARLASHHGRVLVTRATAQMAELISKQYPDAEFRPESRMIRYGQPPVRYPGNVVVVSGGTSDMPIAEEAADTAEWLGCEVERIYDVGVAGIDRLLAQRERLYQANVVIAVAGMEGALPSVVGGLVRRPVIAVPTSVGYGAHLQGLTPMLAMMSSCAAGVTVVNIDNGFGAGYYAASIQRLVWEAQHGKDSIS